MPANTAARSFNQAVTETVNKRVFFGEQDVLLNPNLSPILTLVTKLGNRKPVANPRMEWAEDDYVSVWGQVSNGTTSYDSVATNILVADISLFATGDIVAVPKADSSSAAEETFRVTALSAASGAATLTVTRGVGGSGADTIGPTVDLRILAPAFAEGASLGVPRTTTKVVRISYTQIFRRPVKITKTMAATAQYGPQNERIFQRKKMLEELRKDIESQGLFGRASESLASPGTVRTTMGVKSRLTTNVHNFNTTITETSFLNFAETVFSKDYHGNEKLLACASKIISALDYFQNGNLQITPRETVLGVKVQRYVSTHGEFMIVRDLLLEDGPNGGLGWGDECYALDPDTIHFHPLSGNGENRDTHLLVDVAKNGDDLYADEWLCEGGWEIRHESRHGRAYNGTTFA